MILERKNNHLRYLVFLETNRWCALIGALMPVPSTVPGEKLPMQPVRERFQTATRMCGNVGVVAMEKTSLHVFNVPLTVFLICMTWTEFPGTDNGPGGPFFC